MLIQLFDIIVCFETSWRVALVQALFIMLCNDMEGQAFFRRSLVCRVGDVEFLAADLALNERLLRLSASFVRWHIPKGVILKKRAIDIFLIKIYAENYYTFSEGGTKQAEFNRETLFLLTE